MAKMLDFYTSLFANWVSRGSFVTREAMSSLGIRPLYDTVMTRTWLKKTIIIEKFPTNFDTVMSQFLQDTVFYQSSELTSNKKRKPIRGRRTKIVMNVYNTPAKVELGDMFVRHMSDAENKFEVYDKAFNSLSGADKATGKKFRFGAGTFTLNKKQLNVLKDRYESYMYVYDRTKKRRGFTSSYCLIEVMGREKEDLQSAMNIVEGALGELDLHYSILRGKSSLLLDNFAPASFVKNNKKIPTVFMSDENLAMMTPYMTKGFIGDGQGALFGVDQGSRYPFHLNFFASGSAQVVAIVGQTGSGKTLEAFEVVLSLLGEGHHCSVVDIKGNEWNKLAPYTDYIEISLGERNPRFVNILRLDDVAFDDIDDAKAIFKSAVDGMVGLVKILVALTDKDPYNENDLESLINKSVTKLYYNYKVDPNNPQTFIYTKDMKYKDLIPILTSFESASSLSGVKKSLAKVVKDRCSDFFNGEGVYEGLFDNEITLQEILNHPLVIYSLNKNTSNASTSLLDNIQIFMIAYLDMKKQSIRKRMKLFTIAIYEELQRKYEFKGLLNFICSRATGARSSNLVLILLFNTLSIFKDNDIDHIKSSITTYCVGKLNVDDREIMAEHMDCASIQGMVKQISDTDEDAKVYKNCFAIQYDTGNDRNSLMVKAFFPKTILEELETRDKKVG